MTSCRLVLLVMHQLLAECTFHSSKHVMEGMLSLMVSNLDIVFLSATASSMFRSIPMTEPAFLIHLFSLLVPPA